VSKFAIALVLVLAATAANAQDTTPRKSNTRDATSTNGTKPFLFDGRMRGDGARKPAPSNDPHPNVGAIVQPESSKPER